MIDSELKDARGRMDGAVEATQENFGSVRTGRANPQLFANIQVEYYGVPTPLQQLASFQVPEARTLLISPFDQSALGNIETALRNSDIGANPANDGNVIRVVLPELTEERRREYVKIVRGYAEDGKVAIRNVRRRTKDTLEKFQKDGDLGEDEVRAGLAELDELTKRKTDEIDTLLAAKEKDLMEV